MKSAAQCVIKRIRSKGSGWVFTPKDFLDLAQRSNVDFILHGLVQDNTIRRIGRGLYDLPRQHPKLGDLSPDRLEVAQAIARQNGDTICPTGAQAANMLGLSTQVPAKPVFATTGKAKRVNLGKGHIILVSTRVPPFQKGGKGFLVLQALDYLGKDCVDEGILRRCRKLLSSTDRKQIRKNLSRLKTPWLVDVARQLID
ncbi:MAG: DUF6088 family protein [Micavibrio sp.]